MKPRRAAIIYRSMHEHSAEKKESAKMRAITFSIVGTYSRVPECHCRACQHASDVNQAVTIMQRFQKIPEKGNSR